MRGALAGLTIWICATIPAHAQDTAGLPFVGLLLINEAANPDPVVPLLRQVLAGLGYVEGSNLHLDFRFAEGHAERFPALAKELAAEKADVIVALGDAATRAAQQATRTIPIVAIADDLVASGLIRSMATPGGNTTGVSILATELDAQPIPRRRDHRMTRRGPIRITDTQFSCKLILARRGRITFDGM